MIAQVVEDTIVDVPVILDVPLIEFHTSSSEDVVLAEGLVIVEVELEAIHIVLYDAALTDTTLGEYGVRKCVGVVGVGTQVLIVVAYVGRLHSAHATGQDGVLGIIEEGHRIGVLDVGDEGRTQLLEDIPRGSTLDPKITLSAGAAALTELVEDIVGDVVLRIALCGEQCAARRIGVLDCRGSRLFGGVVLPDDIQPDLQRRQELVVRTHATRVGIGAAADGPPWVDASGE